MTINEAKYIARKIMEAGEVPLLVGHFGVGKTDMIREIANETNRDLIILILSQMEPGDLIGLPSRGEDKTVFLKPDWWPEDGNAIILLDEINRSHRSIRNAIMQLLIDRRIHNHVLPEGVWITAAMNPPDDEYDQAELITDPAFISRFFILEVSPEVDEWLQWASRMKVHEAVSGFIREFPEFLSPQRNVSLRAELKPSPRSWYKLGRVLSNLSDEDIKKYGYTIAAGILGPEAAKVFYDSYLKEKNIPSVEKILFEGQIEKPENIDEINSLVVRIIDYLSNLNDIKLREFEEKIDTVSQNIISLSKVLPKESFYALMRFIVDSAEKSGLYGSVMDKLLTSLTTHEEILEMVKGL